jgi:hypothetical protein
MRLPLISAIVCSKDSRLSAMGFFELYRRLHGRALRPSEQVTVRERERDAVFKCDWTKFVSQ